MEQEAPRHPLHPPVFQGSTVAVVSPNRVTIEVDCDFGLTARRVFQLADFDPRPYGPELHHAAKHCLIVLVGGRKRLVVRPDPHTRSEWFAQSVIRARVYLPVLRDIGTPVGYVATLPEASGPFLEISAYMRSLADRRFDVQAVRDMLNGRTNG